MASGGNGGRGESIFFDQETNQWLTQIPLGNGVAGGTVIDAEGVDMDIYLSGGTTSTSYPTADGFIRAPAGGDAGFKGDTNAPEPHPKVRAQALEVERWVCCGRA